MARPPARVIPVEWLPTAATGWVRRCILHWTAGLPEPTALDKRHYHLLIRQDGAAVRGNTPIGSVASHTRLLNTGSVGIAVCGMLGATPRGHYGPYPLTAVQVERMTQGVAEVCHAYELAVTERTVLCHSEAWRVYRRPQLGKFDIDVLPYESELPADEVHALLRRKVQWYLQRLK